MLRFGIAAGVDLREHLLPFLQENFGEVGAYCFGIALASTIVLSAPVGAENTSPADLVD